MVANMDDGCIYTTCELSCFFFNMFFSCCVVCGFVIGAIMVHGHGRVCIIMPSVGVLFMPMVGTRCGICRSWFMLRGAVGGDG